MDSSISMPPAEPAQALEPARPTERTVHTPGQEAVLREHGFQTAFDPESERALFAARGRPLAPGVDAFSPRLHAENARRIAEMTAAEQRRKREARATERATARARIAAATPAARERLRFAIDAQHHAERRLEQAQATVARAEAAAANAQATMDRLAGLDTEIGRLRASLLRDGDAGDAPLPAELTEGLRLRTAAERRLREITLAQRELEAEQAEAATAAQAAKAEVGETARLVVALHVEGLAHDFTEQCEQADRLGRSLRAFAGQHLPHPGDMVGTAKWPGTVLSAVRQIEAPPDPLAGPALRAWFDRLRTDPEATMGEAEGHDDAA